MTLIYVRNRQKITLTKLHVLRYHPPPLLSSRSRPANNAMAPLTNADIEILLCFAIEFRGHNRNKLD